MATDGQNSSPRKLRQERMQKATLKQRVSWRKFRINGAAGFAEGSLGSSITSLRRLQKELPEGCAIIYQIDCMIENLREFQRTYIPVYRKVALDLAERAEAENGTTNSSSD